MEDERLQWVQKNHTRWRKPTLIGATVKGVLKSPQTRSSAMRRRLGLILQEYTGADLLDHVAIGDIDRGVLTLYVENAAELYQLRLLWEQRLLQLMQSQLPGAGIHEIRFSTSIPRRQRHQTEQID